MVLGLPWAEAWSLLRGRRGLAPTGQFELDWTS